jgi:hypothetical protein
MALWEERERRRAELLSDLDDAEAALSRGEGMIITEPSMQSLRQEIPATDAHR